MSKKFFMSMLATMMVAMLSIGFTSCGDDEDIDPRTSQQDKNDNNNDNTPVVKDIVVKVDAEGNADGGHRFTKIDNTNFYIDEIRYTASQGDLYVSGYDRNFFKGAATIISALDYNGLIMNVTSINNNAFKDCSVITSVTIPNSVTSIGSYAFNNCPNHTSVTIGNGVTSIGNYAFAECTGLTSITIPNSVTSFGSSIFSGCTSLSVTLNSNEIVSKNYDNNNCLKKLFGEQVKEYILGESIQAIGEYAFYGCSGLTSITIPESVTSIGFSAFGACTGLTSITIPESVTSIGSSAFSGCSGLTSITIPNSVTSIGEYAFSRCSGLTSLVVESGNTKYDSRDNCNAIIETETNTLVLGCKNTIIPNSVTSIGSYAFADCTGLTSITIPNSVTSLGSSIFSGCTSLSVTLNSNEIVSKNYNNNNCLKKLFGEQVKEYILGENIQAIGDYAFYGCSGLTSITIPNSVTSIGNRAFGYCSGLTSVTIPESVTSIGSSAFCYCSGLTSVTIPESVTSIGSSAFYKCTGLTSITIPESVTSIGSYAFDGCSGLTSITLGSGVTSIGYNSFSSCSGLKDCYCKATTPPSAYVETFNNTPISLATLHVPASSINSYKVKSPWSGFKSIVAIE